MMKLLNLLMCSVTLLVVGVTDAVNFRDCGSGGASVTSVEITPCQSEPCVLRRGVEYVVRITFTARTSINTRGFSVQGTVNFQPMLVPLPPNGLCSSVFPQCPIEAGGIYTYSYKGAVPPNVPLGVTTLRWELLYRSGAPFVCIEIPVRVQ